jgi:hypothetical protein
VQIRRDVVKKHNIGKGFAVRHGGRVEHGPDRAGVDYSVKRYPEAEGGFLRGPYIKRPYRG